MYCRAWKYTVTSNQSEFENAYGRSGVWFKFFEPCEDYLGHELMKSENGKIYFLMDKWMSKEDYENFIDNNKTDYQALQVETRDLYDEELSLGNYNIVQ